MAPAPKLFMFHVGGYYGNANIELHDVRFSIGAASEDCHDDLRAQWWGKPKSLHLDCWGAVEQVDGFDVSLTAASPAPGTLKLFFLNLGGYRPDEFSETHENFLVAAPDVQTAKSHALARVTGWKMAHRDAGFEVEKAIDVATTARKRGLHIALAKAHRHKPFAFTCKFVRLG